MEDSSMFDFYVQSFRGQYQVQFIEDVRASMEKEIGPNDFVVVDSKVKRLYSQTLETQLKTNRFLELVATEETKSFQGIEPLISQLIHNGFRRGNRLVAVGGGVIQDVTAFVASVIFRGVEWLFYPTTLLAQADSCIGSKTSINFGPFKNQLGGFYPPVKILVDVGFVNTLSTNDLMSGVGEMCHYFLIAGKKEFAHLIDNFPLLKKKDRKALALMVSKSLSIKKPMVERDEFDRNERQIFNYGHSFGHAIESLTNHRIPHGIAVAFGIDISNHVSERMGVAPDGFQAEVRPFLELVWKGFSLENVTEKDMMAALGKDKKNVDDRLGVILSHGYGDMFKTYLEKDAMSSHLKNYFKVGLRK